MKTYAITAIGSLAAGTATALGFYLTAAACGIMVGVTFALAHARTRREFWYLLYRIVMAGSGIRALIGRKFVEAHNDWADAEAEGK